MGEKESGKLEEILGLGAAGDDDKGAVESDPGELGVVVLNEEQPQNSKRDF